MIRCSCLCIVVGLSVVPAASRCVGEEPSSPGPKAVYAMNGRLHISQLGSDDGMPITTGPDDMKPSWARTGNQIVFFRLTKWATDVLDWQTAICVVRADGTAFRKLTDGARTDFNPTWTRDGSNKIIFNRRQPDDGSFTIQTLTADSRPGDERVISDPEVSSYAYTCLEDGRIFVFSSNHPTGAGYFLMQPGVEGTARYEPIHFTFPVNGFVDRVSMAPSDSRICYEFQHGSGAYRYPGRTLYIADFDVSSRTVSNPIAITEREPDPDILWLYPRWTKDETAVIYHCNRSGTSQLYLYRLNDGSTVRASTNAEANYMFPCGEATPK